MENRAYTIIAGIIALLLGIALLTSFWWLGSSHTLVSNYRMLSMAPVTGLNKQAAVRFRGVDVGHVEDISLSPDNPLAIQVDISVDKNLQLTKGSFGHIAAQGLTGLSYIELDDNGSDKTPVGERPIPLNESDMSSMLTSGRQAVVQVQQLLADADKLIKSLNLVLDDKGRQRVSRLLENLDNASSELQPMLKSSATTMDAARASFDKLNASLNEITRIGATVNEDTLPRLHQLTYQVNKDAENLDKLLNTLNEHPESLVFGKPAPRPGPGEPGFKP